WWVDHPHHAKQNKVLFHLLFLDNLIDGLVSYSQGSQCLVRHCIGGVSKLLNDAVRDVNNFVVFANPCGYWIQCPNGTLHKNPKSSLFILQGGHSFSIRIKWNFFYSGIIMFELFPVQTHFISEM